MCLHETENGGNTWRLGMSWQRLLSGGQKFFQVLYKRQTFDGVSLMSLQPPSRIIFHTYPFVLACEN
jgi:hypothetical protein